MSKRYKGKCKLDFNSLDINIGIKRKTLLQKGQLSAIKKYDLHLKRTRRSDETRKNRILLLIQIAIFNKKNFDKVTKEDIGKFVDSLQKRKLKNSTQNHYVTILKHFFKWLGKDKIVEDLYTVPTESPVQADDLWSTEEVKTLIATATNYRDKALVAMLFDLAIERKALIGINLGDIRIIEPDDVYITIRGKRRGKVITRRMKCLLSTYYVKTWYKNHPLRGDPTAPFFVSFSANNPDKRLHPNFTYDKLQYLAKKAGIDKKIHPHLLRHSKLTDLYRKGYRGIELAKFAGWSSTLMEARYVNLAPEEMDAKREEIELGSKKPKPLPQPSQLAPIECPRCKTKNSATDHYCEKCWFPLGQDEFTVEERILQLLRSQLYKDLKEQVKDGETMPDVELMAESYDEMVMESNNPGRKKVEVNKQHKVI